VDYSSESSDPCAEMSTEDIPHYCPSYNVKTIPPFSEKACINHLMTLTCISSLEDVSQQIQIILDQNTLERASGKCFVWKPKLKYKEKPLVGV